MSALPLRRGVYIGPMSTVRPNAFRLRGLPAFALAMIKHTLVWALFFVAAQTVLTTLSATMLQEVFGGALLFPVLSLAVYCIWLRQLFLASGLGRAQSAAWKSIARLVWAHILVGFVLAMGMIILLLTMFLALPVLLIASGVETENYPETTEAFLALMRDTGTIWIASALLFFLCGGLAYLFVRLWVFAAATTHREEVLVFQTWPWTRDHAPTLLGAVGVFVITPLVLAEILYRWAFGWSAVTTGAELSKPSFAEILMHSAFQSVGWVVPIVFAAAISAMAYRAWSPVASDSLD